VVGDQTRRTVQGILFRELDRVRVKGKDEPIEIHEPLGLHEHIAESVKAELLLWQQALQLYRSQQWDAAESILSDLLQKSPDCHLYALYVERIHYLRQHPPGEHWDGVTTFKTK